MTASFDGNVIAAACRSVRLVPPSSRPRSTESRPHWAAMFSSFHTCLAGPRLAQGRGVLKQNFSQVIVPSRYVPEVPADGLWSLRRTPSELILREFIDHREGGLMAPVVLPGEQREGLAGISFGAGRTCHPRQCGLVG